MEYEKRTGFFMNASSGYKAFGSGSIAAGTSHSI